MYKKMDCPSESDIINLLKSYQNKSQVDMGKIISIRNHARGCHQCHDTILSLVLNSNAEEDVPNSLNDIDFITGIESNNTFNQPFCNFPHLTVVEPERNQDGQLSLTAKKII